MANKYQIREMKDYIKAATDMSIEARRNDDFLEHEFWSGVAEKCREELKALETELEKND